MKQTYAHLKTKLYIIRGKAHTTMQKYYWRKSKSESEFCDSKNTDNF